MGNKRLLKYIGNSLLVVFLLFTVIILNISVQKNTTSSNDTKLKTSQQTKLNVAIVNEDQSVRVDKKEYNLGASYVKNIERDNSQNWFVVTRGAADSGLEKGKYQLVLTIPSDFSEKILDINNINVDKTTVTYKVNASGNLQVENDANKLAKDIIADLNSQLVDMYMASILSNLYTAQQNVQASSQVQATNIGTYRTNLLGTATNSKNIFPTLFNMSSSSVDANNALKTILESYSQVFDHLDSSQSTYGKNFDGLLKQRGEDKISHGEFMKQLMEMDAKYLDAETQGLYRTLKNTQESLTTQLGEIGQDNSGADNLGNQVTALEAALTAERAKLDAHKAVIETFVTEKINTYYGLEKGDTLTLEKVLNTANLEELNDAESVVKDQLAMAVAALPAENFSGQSFSEFGISRVTIPNLDYSTVGQFGTPTNGTTSAELAGLVSQATVTSESAGQTGTTARVSWGAPAGVTIHSVSYDGTNITSGQELNLKTGGTFVVHYSVAHASSSTSTEATDATTSTSTATTNVPASSSTEAFINISLDGIQAISTPIDVQGVRNAAAAYAQKTQEIASAYTRVQSLLNVYGSLQKLKNGHMTEVLSNLLIGAIQDNLSTYQASLTLDENGKLDASVQKKMDESIGQLREKIATVRSNNETLGQIIESQINLYGDLKNRLANISTAKGNNEAAFAKTDSELTSLNSEYSSLLTETSSVKSSSQNNIKAAESVNQIFTNLNRELANAQSSTEKLSHDADSLMTQFNEELAANGNFVESFVKVLNNAYENGVPNEILLKFLSSPVAQSSSSVKATVNVYRPFTWILLLEIVSLFTAYLFATQNVIRKVKDKFKLDKLHDTDIMNVGILSFLALTIGLIIGIVSSIQLQVGREYVPSWVLLMVSAGFILIQGQYLLLKHFRVIGMGLTFFMMISFVYLSNAIGTTASLTGFPAFIKDLNALSVLESLLSGYFDGQPAGFFVFFAMLIVLVLLLAANIFIRTRSLQYQMTQTEKV